MTIPVTIRKFSVKILAGIPHTKCATKWAEKRMPKQDKEVGHKRHNFAHQQAGNPLLTIYHSLVLLLTFGYYDATIFLLYGITHKNLGLYEQK